MPIKNRAVDIYIIYEFIKRLSTPFVDTDAFEQGLIDKKGNLTMKRRQMSSKERKVVTLFDLMIFNIKQILAKLPGGDSKFRNFAAALFLLKEDIEHDNNVEVDDVVYLAEELGDNSEEKQKTFSELNEEIATSIGSGAVDNTAAPVYHHFGKARVYPVSTDTFVKCRNQKDRYERFCKYMGEGPVCDHVRAYAKEHPGRSIMIQDKQTSAYTMLKIGSKEKW